MLTEHTLQIRETIPQEDSLIAEHFYRLWLDNQVPTDAIQPDWQSRTYQYIATARQDLRFQAFVAEVHIQNNTQNCIKVVGSVSCQLYAGLYPNILTPAYRQYGYIWGVYVEPDYRKQGIATQLTNRAIAYLQDMGCTQVLLNASPSGQPVYERLGFIPANAMRLDLQPWIPHSPQQ